MLRMPVHPSKIGASELPAALKDMGIERFLMPVHPEKAPVPTSMTESPTVSAVMPVHPLNAYAPMSEIPSSDTDVTLAHPSKACVPISVRPLGKNMLPLRP